MNENIYTYTEARAKRVFQIIRDLQPAWRKMYIQDTDNVIAAEKSDSALLPIYKARRRESLERSCACTALNRIFSSGTTEKEWNDMLTYIDIHIWKEGERVPATMAKEILALAISAE